MKMDLSKFKKVDENQREVTLMHPSGHHIKIAKKGISPDTAEQLDSIPMNLAKGGFAKFSQKFDPNVKKGAQASKVGKSSNTMPGSPTEAKNDFTEPNAIGTSIPKGQLKSELDRGDYSEPGTDVVLQALNRKAPPYGPLGSEPKQHYPPCINPSCKSYGKSHPNCLCYGGNSEHSGVGEAGFFAEGGEVSKEYYCDNNRPHFKKCELYADGGQVQQPQNPPTPPVTNQDPDKTQIAQQSLRKAFNFAEGGPTDAEKLDLAAQEASAGSAPATPQATQTTPDASQPDATPQDTAAPQATADTPNAETPQPAVDQSSAMPQEPQVPPTAVQTAQNTTAALNDEAQKMQSDLDNGHIKPETYKDLFEKKDTLGKIGTVFGLLVGGMGSGLTHQPNMLMEMMNKEISNDLDAQEKSAVNKQNFVKLTQQGLLNKANVTGLNIANQTNQRALQWSAAARVALHAQVQNAMKLPEGSPQRAQAMQALSIMSQGIDKKQADMFSQAGIAQALSEQMGGGQGKNTTLMKSGMMGPEFKELGEDTEQKTIPGIPGQASRPIEGKDRDQIQAMNVLSNKASDLMSFAKQHTGTMSPAQRAIGQQKADEMVNFYNQSLASGALTQGRLGWLDDQIKKNPTGVFTQLMGNNSRLAEIKNSNDMRRNLLLKTYGLSAPGGSSQSQSSSTTSKTGRDVVQKNGKWVYK